MATEWFFPPNNGGEESGLNDAGIQFFRSSGALARETIQNSGDAAAGPDNGPVRVVFELSHVPVAEIPGADQLLDVIGRCREYMLQQCRNPEQRKQNGEEFFERAVGLLSGRTIPVLRVGDYVTTGLEGSDTEKMSPWYRLLRTQGTSSMHGAGGGTYGIGQRAPFAFSALRTVYYSTRTKAGCGLIGKSILCTFEDSGGKKRRPVGYWGVRQPADEGVSRVANAAMMPGRFQRDTVGTDLHILGYVHENWTEDVAQSVLCNFFAAIHSGRLVVELRQSGTEPLVIESGNLDQLLEAEYSRSMEHAETESEKEEIAKTLGMTRYFVRALTTPHNGAPVTGSINGLGEVKLYLTLDEDAPSRVAFMRKPRILVHHRRLRMLKGYAGVFVCETEDGNRILAGLEDPSHREWDKARMPGGGDRIIREISRFVRESLQKLVEVDDGEAQDVPDLWRYLPEEADDRSPKGKGRGARAGKPAAEEAADPVPRKGKIALVRRPVRKPIEVPTRVPESADEGEGEGGAPDRDGRVDGGPPTDMPDDRAGPNPGPDPGDNLGPGTKIPALRPSDVRFRAFFDRDRGCVRLVLASTRRGVGDIALTAVGEDSDYDVVIQSARDDATEAEVPVTGGVLRDVILEVGEPRRLVLMLEGDQHVALSAEVRRAR
jgi:hypothetical protein